MAIKNSLVITLLLALLIGCSKGGSDDMKEKVGEIKDNVKASADHVWSAQVDALNKAKGVENTLMDAAQRQREAMDMDSQ